MVEDLRFTQHITSVVCFCTFSTLHAHYTHVLHDLIICGLAFNLLTLSSHTHTHTQHRSLGIQTCAVNSNDCQSCAGTGLLTDNQTDVCSRNGGTELVKAISRGTRAAIIDCKRQFSNWRWNCPTFKGDYLFGRFVENSKFFIITCDLQVNVC